MLSIWRWLGSLQTAVVALLALAVVLAWGATAETHWGREFASRVVYSSLWFQGLVAFLGLNIFAAAASRYPWRRQQTGFVVTHAGLLVLLAGSLWSLHSGSEQLLVLAEGETAELAAEFSGAGNQTSRVTLVDFQRESNPGQVGNANFTSIIRLEFAAASGHSAASQPPDSTIAMNRPLLWNGVRIYQVGFEERDGTAAISKLLVTRDPGRPVKYLGGAIICSGIAIMFWMRAYFFRRLPALGSVAGLPGGDPLPTGRVNRQPLPEDEDSPSTSTLKASASPP